MDRGFSLDFKDLGFKKVVGMFCRQRDAVCNLDKK